MYLHNIKTHLHYIGFFGKVLFLHLCVVFHFRKYDYHFGAEKDFSILKIVLSKIIVFFFFDKD